ncbi:MAG TPA: hypothetical protein VGD33_04055 [Chitinophagaceae bacterium]
MAESLHDDNLVRYLDGEMDEEERRLFEHKLQADVKLREQLELLHTASETVKYYGLVDQVARVHKKVISARRQSISGKVVPFRRFLRYSIAVAASILFILITWQAYNFFKLSPEAVFAEAFVDYNIPTTRGDGQKDTTAFIHLYKTGNYDSLIKLENKYPAANDQEHFFTGLAHLHQEDAFYAIPPLETVVANAASTYKQDAEYYLAMAYLKNKDYDKALDLMQIIHNNPAHPYNGQFTDKYLRKVQMLKWR